MARWSPQTRDYGPSAFEKALGTGYAVGRDAAAGYERGRDRAYQQQQDVWRAELIERDRREQADRYATEQDRIRRQDEAAAAASTLSRALAGVVPRDQVRPDEEIEDVWDGEGMAPRYRDLAGTPYVQDRTVQPDYATAQGRLATERRERERLTQMGGMFDRAQPGGAGVTGAEAFPVLGPTEGASLLGDALDLPRQRALIGAREEAQARYPNSSDIAADRRAREGGYTDATRRVDAIGDDRRSVLGRRPENRQYIDPLTLRPDTAAFGSALRNWRSDSTAVERRLGEAEADRGYARSLLRPGDRGYAPPDSTRRR